MPRLLTADEVADYLIALAHERGEPVNNMKLQRLMYYAQAWHLALYDRPLFDAKFEAWMSGPVIPSLFRQFKPCGIHPIPLPSSRPELNADTRHFLEDFASEYLPIEEWELEYSSAHEPPWLNARRRIVDDELPEKPELSEEDMRVYFRSLENAA